MLILADRLLALFAVALAALAAFEAASRPRSTPVEPRLSARGLADCASALLFACGALLSLALHSLASPRFNFTRAIAKRFAFYCACWGLSFALSVRGDIDIIVATAVRWSIGLPLLAELSAATDAAFASRLQHKKDTLAALFDFQRSWLRIAVVLGVHASAVLLHMLGRVAGGGWTGSALGLAAGLPSLAAIWYVNLHLGASDEWAMVSIVPLTLWKSADPLPRLHAADDDDGPPHQHADGTAAAAMSPRQPPPPRSSSQSDRFLRCLVRMSAGCMALHAALAVFLCAVSPAAAPRAAVAASVTLELLEPVYALLLPLARVLSLALQAQSASEELARALAAATARAAEETRATETRRRFLRVSFHELRGPLNSCSLAIEALRALVFEMQPSSRGSGSSGAGGSGGPAASPTAAARAGGLHSAAMLTEAQQLCDMALASCSTSSAILNSVLSLSAIEEGVFRLRCAPASLRVLARRVQFQMQPWANAANVTLCLDLPPGAPHLDSLHCDASRLQQVLTNWLSNALKVLRQDGSGRATVRVVDCGVDAQSASHGGRCCAEARGAPECAGVALPPGYSFSHLVARVRLEVEDNGPGIPTSEQQQLLRSWHELSETGASQRPQLKAQRHAHQQQLHAEAQALAAEAAVAEGRGGRDDAVEEEEAAVAAAEPHRPPPLPPLPSTAPASNPATLASLLRRRLVGASRAGGAATTTLARAESRVLATSGGDSGSVVADGALLHGGASDDGPHLRLKAPLPGGDSAAGVPQRHAGRSAVPPMAAAATASTGAHTSSRTTTTWPPVAASASSSPPSAAEAPTASVFQLEPSFGLGLGITRSIIDAFGGTMGLRSTPGEGATLYCDLVLPLLRFRASAVTPASTSATAAAAAGGGGGGSWGGGAEAAGAGSGGGGDGMRAAAAPPPQGVVPLHLEGEPVTHAELLQPLPGDSPLAAGAGGGGLLVAPLRAPRSALLLAADAAAAAARAGGGGSAPAGAPSPAAVVARRHLRFLVAEDEPLNRRLLVRLLKLRYRDALVLEAQDGELAVEAYARMAAQQQAAAAAGAGAEGDADDADDASACFDVLLLDCQMPRQTGLEAAREIRRLEAVQEAAAEAAAAAAATAELASAAGGVAVPRRRRSISATHPLRRRRVQIIGVTGNAMLEDQQAFVSAGADEVLIKPVSGETVYASIERRLATCGRGLAT